MPRFGLSGSIWPKYSPTRLDDRGYFDSSLGFRIRPLVARTVVMHHFEAPPDPGPGTEANSTESDRSAVYGDFLERALQAQEARKASFEQRGLAVLTSSGTLVTLLFGLAAVVTKTGSHPLRLTSEERVWLACALALFVASGIAALVTNLPITYQGVTATAIRDRLEDDRFLSPGRARGDIAKTEVKLLADAQAKNAIKGWTLFAALLLEVGAVFCVGVAVLEVINP